MKDMFKFFKGEVKGLGGFEDWCRNISADKIHKSSDFHKFDKYDVDKMLDGFSVGDVVYCEHRRAIGRVHKIKVGGDQYPIVVEFQDSKGNSSLRTYTLDGKRHTWEKRRCLYKVKTDEKT